jgi:hypothetical protein
MAARTKRTRSARSATRTTGRAPAQRGKARAAGTSRWSKRVTETSDAMDLQAGVFKKKTPRAIALSVKRSAERSNRRKSPPFRSAMSMLTFYVNRGGRNLSAAEKQRLLAAKDELRRLFGKETAGTK